MYLEIATRLVHIQPLIADLVKEGNNLLAKAWAEME